MKKELRDLLSRVNDTIRFIEDDRTVVSRRYGNNLVEITKFAGCELNQLLNIRERIETMLNK